MILKLNNKDNTFYNYMGKVFGSRLIERQINDRIYDDTNKEWYIYVEEDKVNAFVSVSDGVIKNVYTMRDDCLKALLKRVKKDIKIVPSVVTKIYKDIYLDSGFTIDDKTSYKNFLTIY